MNYHSGAHQPQVVTTIRCPVVLQALGFILCIILITCNNLSYSQHSHQDNNTTNNDHMQQELLSKLVASTTFQDPFAITFEDFLKEANKISTHHISSSPKDSASAISNSNNEAGLIIDEEMLPESVPPPHLTPHSSPVIDYVFPSAKPKHEIKENTFNYSSSGDGTSIQLMFSWNQLLTHKCSKTCGKGYRMYHLSCIDLEYRVRVEDELCFKANLTKPKDLSEEPCNQIDCPPEWMSVEFQECSSEFNEDGSCRRNLYKREQCAMVNHDGIQVVLHESKCNPNDASNHQTQVQTSESDNLTTQTSETVNLLDTSLDYSLEDTEKNNILSSSNYEPTRYIGSYAYEQGYRASKIGHNEPFFDVGPWSECWGAPVDKLGTRTRQVVCRLYLSRSSRFTNLPDSSCRGLAKPETEEACYMDSGPATDINVQPIAVKSTELDSPSHDNESLDETVYDSDLTRYIWRKDGWTRCSAECLGGQRESLIECWDKVAGAVVSQSFCDLQSKPIPTIEECNTIPCPLEWKMGPFSMCSRACGSAGVRTRSVACVRKYSHMPTYETFSEEECKHLADSMPHKIEPCNRFDCRPEWNLGPWSECSKCGEGLRTRVVVCVQEFAGRDRPLTVEKENNHDLLEAMMLSAHHWYPGKVTQIPSTECYEEYKTVPVLEEKCFNRCPTEAPYIDAAKYQDYRMTKETMKKKTINVKIGGKVRLIEGKNLKIKCKVHKGYTSPVGALDETVEWTKDGVTIFHNDSRMADKQYDVDDNLIIANDVVSSNNEQPMADQPSGLVDIQTSQSANSKDNLASKIKTPLHVRSWSHYLEPEELDQKRFSFIPNTPQGRFLLVGDNTLKIKKLRLDDTGIYSCSYGQLRESIEVTVVRRNDMFRDGSDVVYN